MTDASAWVTPLPKIELQIHLEGAMRPETVCDMSFARLGWNGDLPPGWQHTYYTYTDFAGFMAQLTPRLPFRPDEYARIARECFEDLARLGAVYTEVSFDAPVREVGGDSRWWPIAEALEEERRRAEDRLPIRINLIVGLMRSLPVEVATYRVELAAQARDRGIGIVAVDLHGDEEHFAPAPFAPAFARARELGLGLRAHAGEAAGPDNIRDSIDLLGVRRIAHGTRALEDPELAARLRAGGITLELCPTSNVRTAVVPSFAAHPFRALYDLGVPVTVNSDDPLPFFTDIEREYRLLVEEFGLERGDLLAITLNAVRTAFLSESERAALAALIRDAYAQRRPAATA